MARKVDPKAKPRQPRKKKVESKEQAQRFLAQVPEQNVFWCSSGATIRDMKELAQGLVAMSDDDFAHHVNSDKNDFCNWIRDVIGDEELAVELAKVTSRLDATGCVTTRVAILSGILA